MIINMFLSTDSISNDHTTKYIKEIKAWIMMDIFSVISGLNWDQKSAILFVAIMGVIIYLNRDKVKVQKILGPFVYIIMYRTKLGLGLMNRWAEKYRELIKLYGYISLGLGFTGMFMVAWLFVNQLIRLIIRPETTEAGASLVLPFTNIPGIGYLSFWHWIICIFILAIIHEFAHGVVARAHNIRVKSSGFAIFGILAPLLPAAFVEPDEKQMKKKKDIVQYSVFAAGPIINMILAFILLAAFPYVADLTNSTPAPFEDKFTEKAGFSYTIINASENKTYPSEKAGMPYSGIINSVDGKDVNDSNDFIFYMLKIRPGDNISIGTTEGEFLVTTVQNPEDDERAFIGISGLKNERRPVKGVAMWKIDVFYWFRGLIRWLFLLNFFIGLMNLLPLGIVDGGRMLGVALEKIIGDKKKAQKIWGYIGLFFFFILLFALFVEYVGNPFLWLP